MKALRLSLATLLILSILAIVAILPSLGGRSVGVVGGWVWKSMWTVLGVVGLVVTLSLGGAAAIVSLWRRDSESLQEQTHGPVPH